MTDVTEVRSARTDGDSWDITESVGARPPWRRGGARGRNRPTRPADPRRLRLPAGVAPPDRPGPNWPAATRCGCATTRRAGARTTCRATTRRCAPTTSTRTSPARCASGIRQIVILAAGLDSRAYRLDWPAGPPCIRDRPAQSARLQGLDARRARRIAQGAAASRSRSTCATTGRPRCSTRASTRDRPTAWLAEGLLPYLRADAQDRLFERLTALSAAGQPDRRRGVQPRSARLRPSGARPGGNAPPGCARNWDRRRRRHADLHRSGPRRRGRLAGRPRLAASMRCRPTTRWPGWAARCPRTCPR